MGAKLAMNPAAVLTNRRPNAQRLADGTATLAQTNQSDQGNFPGSESIFSREKNTRGNQVDTLTPDSPTPTSKASSTVLKCLMSQAPVWAPSLLRGAAGH
jgi:hypothetical protein